MSFELIVVLVGFSQSISSIIFSYLAYKRTNTIDQKTNGKTEGVMFSDIGYIKACVDRVEKNLNKVDERDRSIGERLAKVEESVVNVTKKLKISKLMMKYGLIMKKHKRKN